SGDLSFSGAAEEYKLVEGFLDSLAGAVRLPRRCFYLVAGNHDVNRKAQALCFAGARASLTSPSRVDEFLGQSQERATLFQRLTGYFAFEEQFCTGQRRFTTPDGLGYVAPINVEGLPVCLLGINSSWMCGGDDDKGNLLVGDRPVIEALELLRPNS